MISLGEIEKKVKEIDEKLEEVNKMIEEYNKQDNLKWDKNWKPKKNDDYYFIDSGGEVDYYTNYYTEEEDMIIKYSRIFQTREQAEKWLEIDTYLREKSFEPDWKDKKQRKYYLMYDCENDKFNYCYHLNVLWFDQFYFKSEEIIDEILEKYSKKELKFYFGVEE